MGGRCKPPIDLREATPHRTSVAMHWFTPSLLLMVAGCAGTDGTWPSLARRSIEGPRPGAVVTAEVAGPSIQAAVVSPVIVDVSAQVATIDRDAANLGTRIAEQRATAAVAASAARGSKSDSEAWAKAQFELTRLERLGNQLGDLRGRLDAIAGKLAAAAGTEADVTAALRSTGMSIGRLDAQIAEYDATYAAASAAATP